MEHIWQKMVGLLSLPVVSEMKTKSLLPMQHSWKSLDGKRVSLVWFVWKFQLELLSPVNNSLFRTREQTRQCQMWKWAFKLYKNAAFILGPWSTSFNSQASFWHEIKTLLRSFRLYYMCIWPALSCFCIPLDLHGEVSSEENKSTGPYNICLSCLPYIWTWLFSRTTVASTIFNI